MREFEKKFKICKQIRLRLNYLLNKTYLDSIIKAQNAKYFKSASK